MRKLIILLTMVMLLSAHIPKEGDDELVILATSLTKSDLTIDSWQMTIKETLSEEKAMRNIMKLKEKYEVTKTLTKEVVKYKTIIIDELNEIEVIHYAIIQKQNINHVQFMTEIKGKVWSHQTLVNYQKQLKEIEQQYFTKNSTKFACLSTHNDVIIKTNDFFEKMIEQFNIQHVSTQLDRVKDKVNNDIIYGYTSMFSDHIYIESVPMNIQIVKKQVNNKHTKLLIGTPMLINEY